MTSTSRPVLVSFLVSTILAGSAVGQSTIYVDDNALGDPGPGDPLVSDPNEDGSQANPFDAIAEGVLAAQTGDIVLLRSGLYTGQGNAGITISKSITVRSEYGAASCKIACGGNSNAFSIFLASPTIQGITIENGGGTTSGGAIRMQGGAAPSLLDCVFHANFASNGGAVYCENSSPEIRNCVFSSNSASNGGAIAVRLGSTPDIVGCTFTTNTALIGGAIYAGDSSQTTVRNCVLWADHAAGFGHEIFVGLNTGGVTVSVGWSDVAGGAAGVTVEAGATLDWAAGNIDADPMFAAGFGSDVHLGPGSPCIDVGNGSLVARTDDFDGDARVVGATVDMGADEFFPRFYITGDKSTGGSITLNVVGAGNASPILLFISTGLLPAPIPTAFGPWHLTLPTTPPFVFPGSLTPSGYLAIFTQIPAALPAGIDVFTQTLIGDTLSTPEVLSIEP